MKKIKSVAEDFLNLLYPLSCISCGCYLYSDNRSEEKLLAHYFCADCSKEISYMDISYQRNGAKGYAFSGFAAPFLYEGAIKSALLRLKFCSDISSVPFFSSCLENEIRTVFFGISFDIITCVPSTGKSLYERGYNQSELIASKLKIDGIKDFSLLRKNKDTRVQHMLDLSERKKNVENAYSVSQGRDVKGKTILLIDDILTSGATCDAITRELRYAGAKAVYVGCVAKTPPKEENNI